MHIMAGDLNISKEHNSRGKKSTTTIMYLHRIFCFSDLMMIFTNVFQVDNCYQQKQQHPTVTYVY